MGRTRASQAMLVLALTGAVATIGFAQNTWVEPQGRFAIDLPIGWSPEPQKEAKVFVFRGEGQSIIIEWVPLLNDPDKLLEKALTTVRNSGIARPEIDGSVTEMTMNGLPARWGIYTGAFKATPSLKLAALCGSVANGENGLFFISFLRVSELSEWKGKLGEAFETIRGAGTKVTGVANLKAPGVAAAAPPRQKGEYERLASQLVNSYNKALELYLAKDCPGALGVIERELLAVAKSFYLTYYLKAVVDSTLTERTLAERSKSIIKDVDDYFYWKKNSDWMHYLKIDTTLDAKHEAAMYQFRAMSEREIGDYKSAIADITRAIILVTRLGDPVPISEGYQERGATKEAMGDLEGAEKDYLEALKINPNYLRPLHSLLFLYSDRKDADKCFDMLFRMTKLNPDWVYDLLLDEGEGLSWLGSDPRIDQVLELVGLEGY